MNLWRKVLGRIFPGAPRTSAKVSRRPRLQLESLEERVLLCADEPMALTVGLAAPSLSQPVHQDPEPAVTADGATSGLAAALPGLPALSSRPGAYYNLYLDFDGHFESVWGGYYNVNTPAFDMDGNAGSFNSQEAAVITETWQRVVEIFAPFNINVTTVDPGHNSNGRDLLVSIGGNGSWIGPYGGVAYIDSFTNSWLANTVYVFADNLGDSAKYLAVVSAHEAGHAYGLEHQSLWSGNQLIYEYNPGNSSRAPIMGSGNAARDLWWIGPTPYSPNDIQDDLAVVGRSTNGFGFYNDGWGHSRQTASSWAGDTGQYTVNGTIAQLSQSDYFSFSTGGVDVSLSLTVPLVGATLDARLELLNSSGSVVSWADPSNSLSASLTATGLGAGVYYVRVASHGLAGDVGKFTLTATFTNNVSYRFLDGGTLQKWAGAWTTLDNDVANYTLADDGSLVYLKTNGNLFLYRNNAWTLLDRGTGMFQLAGDGTLYDLKTNGNLWHYRNGAWTQLDSRGSSIQLAGNGTLYLLKSDGTLRRFVGTTASTLDSDVASFGLDGNNTLYELKRNGNLYVYGSGWSLVAGNVVDAGGDGTGSYYYLLNDGSLWRRSNGVSSTLTSTVTSFQAVDGTVYALKAGGTLHRYLNGAWTQINQNVSSSRLVADGTLYALKDDGTSWRYRNNAWTLLDSGGVTDIEVSINGAYYELKSNGRLWKVDVNGWTLLDSGGVNSFSVAANGALYELKHNGNFWKVDASGWTLLESGGAASFTVASNGMVFKLRQGDGSIWQIDASGTTWLDSDVVAIGLARNGTLYASRSDGSLRQFVNGAWTTLENTAASFQLDGRGIVHELRNNGDLYVRDAAGAWTRIDGNVVSYATAGGLTYLRADGTLWSYNGTATQLNSNVADYLAGDDILHVRMTNGDLFSYRGGAWTLLDQNVRDIRRLGNGTLYELKNDNNLWQYNAAGWSLLSANMATIALAGNGTLYAVKLDGSLWQYNYNGWLLLDSAGVKAIDVAAHGALYDLKYNGNLWLVTNAGWTKLDSNVSTMSLASNDTLYELKGTGEVVRVTSQNATVLLDPSTTAVALEVALDGTLCELLTNGTLRTYNLNGWTTLATGIASFRLAPGGYLVLAEQTAGGTLTFNV